MKKRIFAALLALIALLGLLAGCSPAGMETDGARQPERTASQAAEETAAPDAGDAEETEPETPVEYDHGTVTVRPAPDAGDAEETAPSGPEAPAETENPPAVEEDGEYTAPEDVAEYLHAYGHLPGNFITKKDAQALGWPGGDLWKYAPGKSLGGDWFGNYEGLLPKGPRYRECDVNYAGGGRGAERVIYGDDGSVYYTADHYASFTQLY